MSTTTIFYQDVIYLPLFVQGFFASIWNVDLFYSDIRETVHRPSFNQVKKLNMKIQISLKKKRTFLIKDPISHVSYLSSPPKQKVKQIKGLLTWLTD